MSDIYCFDGLVHHYYMERLNFCALIKHIMKRGFQKDKILCAEERIWQPLFLNAAQKFKIQKK